MSSDAESDFSLTLKIGGVIILVLLLFGGIGTALDGSWKYAIESTGSDKKDERIVEKDYIKLNEKDHLTKNDLNDFIDKANISGSRPAMHLARHFNLKIVTDSKTGRESMAFINVEHGSSVNRASVSYKPVFEHGRRMINDQWLHQHKGK